MNQPTPAIVSQDGVRRLPRRGLLLFCAVYVLAGFVGRDPWRAELASFGYMLELSHGHANWLAPGLLGQQAQFNALLPYWLGALAIKAAPAGMAPFVAVRIVFASMLTLALTATWYGVYYLARSPQAQPVSFAFGGEARPADYARTIADGGLLALLACLGLAEQGHLVGPVLAQLCFAALVHYALAALPYRTWAPAVLGSMGMLGLALSGAPGLALLLGGLGLLVHAVRKQDWLAQAADAIAYEQTQAEQQQARRTRRHWLIGIAAVTLACCALAWALGLWRWRMEPLASRWVEWRNLGRMLLWFTWPAWLLALWTLWRWRHHWRGGLPSRHIALPLGMALVSTVGALLIERRDNLLLVSLPAYAALAAFALPTLRRSASALIDWFTLIFFTLAAAYLWFMWVAMQTGQPAGPARLALRRLPDYAPQFNGWLLLAALLATAGWLVLVRWRTRRLRPAIWKSMILPAGGVTLCWTLLTTLWLPPINHMRSDTVLVQLVQGVMREQTPSGADCVQQYGLDDAQIVALQYHAGLQLTRERDPAPACRWLLANTKEQPILPHLFDMQQWQIRGVAARPGNKEEGISIYARRGVARP